MFASSELLAHKDGHDRLYNPALLNKIGQCSDLWCITMDKNSSPYVFVSSKMRELAAERKMLQDLLPTLGRDVVKLESWIFEGKAPASNKSIRDVYLEALKHSVLYIGLFWKEYGEWTIDEFERASEWGIERHIYVKDVDAESRDPRLQAYLDKQSDVRFGITARWYRDVDDLREQVTRSVEKWLLDRQIAYHSATSAVMARVADDIPELPRKLIGRENIIAEAETLLYDGERVLLHGLAGIGKSALAAKVAAQHIESNRGPVIWLKVGSTDAGALFEAIGRLFGEQQAIAARLVMNGFKRFVTCSPTHARCWCSTMCGMAMRWLSL
ncbi:MAG: DUF4062 domain-containing protein [Anaerolineae bacterium]|nr:DUF4062 domain-containing protein [Anaerolineae bacterium]